jgi:hypothetical protein
MSKREAVLCDKATAGSERFVGDGKPNVKTPGKKCPNMAIGQCPICDDDICVAHALHPKGGLAITLKLTGVNTSTNPPLDKTMADNHCALPVCFECGVKISGYTYFEDAARDVIEMTATNLRAALAARALKLAESEKP